MNLKKKWNEYKFVIPAGIVTGILVLAFTGVFYGLFGMHLIQGHEAMTPEVKRLISADNINVVTELIANFSYGCLLVLIFKWGKIYKPLVGAGCAVLVGILSDYYYALALYSTTKNMFTITSISIDAFTYALVNIVVGAGLAWYLGRRAKKMGTLDLK